MEIKTTNSAQVFTENWNKYQQIIRFNYMHHAELAAHTKSLFAALPVARPHVLDIGCGDGLALLPALQPITLNSYTGYDLSPFAIALAKKNFSHQKFASTFIEGDMQRLIAQETQQFDVINAGFAIHHLQDDEKQIFLHACYNRLQPGGTMIYTDVFRQQGVSRAAYIKAYFAYIQNEWTMMTDKEKQPIYEHVREYDFPSEINETINWLTAIGFSMVACHQPDERHVMLVLNKPQ